MFVEKSKNIHENEYDYSLVNYKGAQEQVEIICFKHGSFWQRAEDHWNGHGCSKCISRISDR